MSLSSKARLQGLLPLWMAAMKWHCSMPFLMLLFRMGLAQWSTTMWLRWLQTNTAQAGN